MIGIIDYGMGNLGSVANALGYLSIDAEILNSPSSLTTHEHLILPGVGSFTQAMRCLDDLGWTAALRARVSDGVPLLGICLGMQLMFEAGEEHGVATGLGLLRGQVVQLTPDPPCRVPHVGWNSLSYSRRHPVFKGVKEHIDFYFSHSFKCIPSADSTVIARCDHGGEFVAVVGKKNIVGVQFHPEKSQDMGLKILENFAQWDGAC